MHSDEWWERILDGALTADEERAWEVHLDRCSACRREYQALMNLDVLFETVPVPEAPEGFAERTLQRWELAKRRRALWAALGIVVVLLGLVILQALALGSTYVDVTRALSAFAASRDMLLQALMRASLGLMATGKAIVPLALILSAVLLFFLMPNGVLATLAILMVRKRGEPTGVEVVAY
jgi:anti-sigma factor RsiW